MSTAFLDGIAAKPFGIISSYPLKGGQLLGRLICFCFLFTSGAVAGHSQVPESHDDPDQVRFVTSDVKRFWSALERSDSASLASNLDSVYLQRGTSGLRDFIPNRIRSSNALADAVRRRRARYEEVRAFTERIGEHEKGVRAPLYALKYLFPEAVLPDIYFVIGRLSSGGTATKSGVIVGTEMIRDSEQLRNLVAHEVIHYQQIVTGQLGAAEKAPSLLAMAVLEGSADFVAELISGVRGNLPAHEYGLPREADLWKDFASVMHGVDGEHWFSEDPPGERPLGLGYFLGYRIAEAFYARAPDKKAAIKELLTNRSFTDLLEKSGYDG